MKNSISKIIAILFIATTITSCGVDMLNKVSGNRNVISQERKIDNNFTGIKVSTGINLYITQGSKNKVSVEADENLHDIIITEVVDGVLKIYSEKSIWKSKAKKVHVTIKDLTSLKASSGSYAYTEDTIKSDKVSVTASSGATINITLDAANVETSSSSGSQITIKGNTVNHTVSASSGSSINAYGLVSENATAKASSGSSIDVYASEKIDSKASSGAHIDFKGNPKLVNKKSSSGGSVSAR